MAGEKTSYRLDEQVGYLLRLASQRHSVIFQDRIAKGLTPTQFATLIRVAECGEVSQNQLGRLAAMDIATVKGVVDRLRAKGLLSAAPDPEDRRRSLISLTEEAEGLMDRLYQDGLDISNQTLSPLKASERKTLVDLLKKIS